MTQRKPNDLWRMWFPIALGALLVIAIPGVILFFLNLIGKETNVNRWLEDNLRLSYHIPIPWWGALLLFLAPLLLILLYFLKLKRKPMTVPSTFLWKKSIEDLHVNALFQWLRNNILLILQLLVLIGLIYAILAPQLHGAGGTGKHYILMIDNSASMTATDAGPSRLERAKAEAIKEIDAASDNDTGMLIVFNSRAEIRQSYTTDRALLRQRVEEIEQTQRPTNVEEALHLADSLANPKHSTENEAVRPQDAEPGKERTYANPEGVKAEVHLYSDGRFADVPEFVLGNLDLRYHAIGSLDDGGRNNVAIVTFNAIRDESDPTVVQVFATVLNFSKRSVSGRVQLEVYKQGQLFKRPAKAITIPAFEPAAASGDGSAAEAGRPGEVAVTFEVSDIDDQTEFTMHAKIEDISDMFPLDNEAFLVIGLVRKARVLIVSPGNKILSAFFDDDSTKAIAEVTWLDAAQFAGDDGYRRQYLEPARNGSYDLVIFDRAAPRAEEDMPRGNTVFIGQAPPPYKIDPAKKAEKVFVKGWFGQHAAMRYLTGLAEIGAGVVYAVDELPPRTPRLLEGENNLSMMVVLSRSAYADLVQLFPLIDDAGRWNTNWPLQPSFPIFWRNVLYSLGNVSDAAAEDVLHAGQPKRLRPGGAVDRVTVINPANTSKSLDRPKNRNDFDFQDTEMTGVYAVEWSGGGRSFAVNLLDAQESNLYPRENIQIGHQTVAAGEARRQSRELWKWAVAIGLLFLLLEWYIYNRRVYV